MAEESSFDAAEYREEFTPTPAPPPVPPPAPTPAYELRPLTTGEILDRTFYLYRTNFWLFASISAVAAAVASLTSIGQILFQHFSHFQGKPGTQIFASGVALAIWYATLVVYLVVYSLVHAATVSAVASLYLGDPTTMGAAFRAVKGRWLRYFGIAMWQIWSGMWLFMVLFIPLIAAGVIFRSIGMTQVLIGVLAFFVAIGGLVYGVIAYIRNSLAVPVEVMEDSKVRAAMRRSKVLAAGTKGRIFLLGLLLFALYCVAIGIQTPLGMMIVKAGPHQVILLQAVSLFVGFVITTLITPIGGIGLCLFYIDQRVRKEGFDIEFMLERSGPRPDEVPETTAALPETIAELPQTAAELPAVAPEPPPAPEPSPTDPEPPTAETP